jgi:hypothetical protein
MITAQRHALQKNLLIQVNVFDLLSEFYSEHPVNTHQLLLQLTQPAFKKFDSFAKVKNQFYLFGG